VTELHASSELLNDAYRMLLAYYPPILSHALHVYESAVATMPECALFATVRVDATCCVRLLSARGSGWTTTPRVIKVHRTGVITIDFSPDGTQLVTGCSDGTVRIWSARTGAPLAVLKGHTEKIEAVAFYSNGTRIVSASATLGCSVRLWDAHTFEELDVIYPDSALMHTLACSRAASLIAFGCCDGAVYVWDPSEDIETFFRLPNETRAVRAVACSPDGSKFISVSKDGEVRVREYPAGDTLAALEFHGSVTSVSFSPDGARMLLFITGEASHQLWGTWKAAICDIWTGEPLFVFQSYDSDLLPSVAFSPDSRQLVYGSHISGMVRVCDMKSRKQLATLRGRIAGVRSVSYSPDGEQLAAVSVHGTIWLWNVPIFPEPAEAQENGVKTSVIVFSPDGQYLASAVGNHARVWDKQTCSEISRLKGHNSVVTAMAFSPDGLRIATGAGGDDGSVRVWDTRTGRQLSLFNGLESPVSGVQFSPDGMRVISCSTTIRVWDIPSGEQLSEFPSNDVERSVFVVSPDGLWILYGREIWNTVTGAQIAVLEGFRSWPSSDSPLEIVFSSDGKWLHTNDAIGLKIVHVWDFQNILRRSTLSEILHVAPIRRGSRARQWLSKRCSQNRVAVYWEERTGWLSCKADAIKGASLRLCWLPIELRGRAVFNRWTVAIVGMGGNLTILDLTDTIQRLESLGILFSSFASHMYTCDPVQ
jgi:WD40 repeat protein